MNEFPPQVPLPERWYLAALVVQWERQLGRDRRLLASTDRAAITAPILQLPAKIQNGSDSEGLNFKSSVAERERLGRQHPTVKEGTDKGESWKRLEGRRLCG